MGGFKVEGTATMPTFITSIQTLLYVPSEKAVKVYDVVLEAEGAVPVNASLDWIRHSEELDVLWDGPCRDAVSGL